MRTTTDAAPNEPPAPGASAPPVTVDELVPGSTGRWLVRSRRSEHLLDLDAGTYGRTPGAAPGRFPHDCHTVNLTRVERWPRVGDVLFVWVDDHEAPTLIEHWHQSSTIVSITRVSDGGGTATGPRQQVAPSKPPTAS